MSIFTGKMSTKTKNLYDFMWGEKEWLKDLIEPTAKSERSDTTYQFKGKDEEKEKILGEIFGLDKEKLKAHFKSVCGGDGNERKKIGTLHSSSLCGMLFFYNVGDGDDNELNMQINGETIVFNTVTFEFKNSVISKASNMDIVLLSKDKKHVLFLESKFSEYYMSASKKSSKISEAYRTNDYSEKIYNNLELMGIKVSPKEPNADKKFVMQSDKEVYLDGIKQMISHYIGVRRRISGEENKVDKHNDKTNADKIIEAVGNGAKVYLGEILFDFENTNSTDQEMKMHFKSVADVYREKYEKLAKYMNELISNSDKAMNNEFVVLEKNLNYSDVKKWHDVDAKVLEYYNL